MQIWHANQFHWRLAGFGHINMLHCSACSSYLCLPHVGWCDRISKRHAVPCWRHTCSIRWRADLPVLTLPFLPTTVCLLCTVMLLMSLSLRPTTTWCSAWLRQSTRPAEALCTGGDSLACTFGGKSKPHQALARDCHAWTHKACMGVESILCAGPNHRRRCGKPLALSPRVHHRLQHKCAQLCSHVASIQGCGAHILPLLRVHGAAVFLCICCSTGTASQQTWCTSFCQTCAQQQPTAPSP